MGRFVGVASIVVAIVADIGISNSFSIVHTDVDVSNIDDLTYQFAVDPVAPVAPAPLPEPATWAMMVVGFGLAGSAARRGHRGARGLA